MANSSYWLLAEADVLESAQEDVISMEEGAPGEVIVTDSGVATDETAQPPVKKNTSSLLIMIALFVFMFFVLFRGPRKQQKEQNKMREGLERNDRVMTIGGIFGTIIDMKDDEITIKIDESNNTKMKISRTAIAKKLS